MKRSRTAGAVRVFSRLIAAVFSLLIVTLICVQFVRITGENLALSRSLSSVRQDIVTLRHRRDRDLLDIRRLSDPQGAVPEIHDRLRLVRPNEAIIFVRESGNR